MPEGGSGTSPKLWGSILALLAVGNSLARGDGFVGSIEGRTSGVSSINSRNLCFTSVWKLGEFSLPSPSRRAWFTASVARSGFSFRSAKYSASLWPIPWLRKCSNLSARVIGANRGPVVCCRCSSRCISSDLRKASIWPIKARDASSSGLLLVLMSTVAAGGGASTAPPSAYLGGDFLRMLRFIGSSGRCHEALLHQQFADRQPAKLRGRDRVKRA